VTDPNSISEQTPIKSTPAAKENTLLNIIFNIVLPVAILNQFSKRFGDSGPLIGLLIALAIPFCYGTFEYIKNRKHNWMSILGLVNILLTGGFALIKLEGLWFAVKEALFPFIIGVAVMVSALTQKPLFKLMIWNPTILNTEKVILAITEKNNILQLNQLFKKTTYFFSISFFISAALNFILAVRIFLPIDQALTETQKSIVLNEQIAAMTWQGYVVIALPLMVLMMLLLWYTMRQLQKLSGLQLDELMAANQSSK
jgi:hypothetical protein